MEFRLTPASSLLAIAVIATATIAAAWAFELLGGYVPCPLCLQQRWPYYAVVPLAIIAYALRRTWRVVRSALLLIGLIMLAGATLAAYHAGIEWGWWQGPQTCSAAGGLSGGLPDLQSARVIRCDEASWRLFGLSFAGWNFVVSLILVALAVSGARKHVAHGSSSVSQ